MLSCTHRIDLPLPASVSFLILVFLQIGSKRKLFSDAALSHHDHHSLATNNWYDLKEEEKSQIALALMDLMRVNKTITSMK